MRPTIGAVPLRRDGATRRRASSKRSLHTALRIASGRAAHADLIFSALLVTRRRARNRVRSGAARHRSRGRAIARFSANRAIRRTSGNVPRRRDLLAQRQCQPFVTRRARGKERQHADTQAMRLGAAQLRWRACATARTARASDPYPRAPKAPNGFVQGARLGRRLDIERQLQGVMAARELAQRLWPLAHVGKRAHQMREALVVGSNMIRRRAISARARASVCRHALRRVRPRAAPAALDEAVRSLSSQ